MLRQETTVALRPRASVPAIEVTTPDSLEVAVFTFNLEARLYGCDCREAGLGKRLGRIIRRRYIRSAWVRRYLDTMVEANGGRLPQVIVINLQEANMARGRKTDKLLRCWLQEVLRRDDNYAMLDETVVGINSCGLVGVRTGVIASKDYNSSIRFTAYKSAAFSQLGKGSISVDMHLQREEEHYHVHFINTHLPFVGSEPDYGLQIRDQALSDLLGYCEQTVIDNQSLSRFLSGDLNYRICFPDSELEEEYLQLAERGQLTPEDMARYLPYDQLQTLRETLLVDYREGPDDLGPQFLPTCKLLKTQPPPEPEQPVLEQLSALPSRVRARVRRTSVSSQGRPYHVRKEGQVRTPSWCDRILHYGNVDCLCYDSFDHGTTTRSDHRPVYGLYRVYSHEDSPPPLSAPELGHRDSINGVTSARRGSSIGSFFLQPPKVASIQRVRRLTGQFTSDSDSPSPAALDPALLETVPRSRARRPSVSLPDLGPRTPR